MKVCGGGVAFWRLLLASALSLRLRSSVVEITCSAPIVIVCGSCPRGWMMDALILHVHPLSLARVDHSGVYVASLLVESCPESCRCTLPSVVSRQMSSRVRPTPIIPFAYLKVMSCFLRTTMLSGCRLLVLSDCLISINNLPRLFSPTPLQVPQNVSFQLLPSSKCFVPVLMSCWRRVGLLNFWVRSSFITCILTVSQSSRSWIFRPRCFASLGSAHCLIFSRYVLLLDFAAWNACSTVGYVSLSSVTYEL